MMCPHTKRHFYFDVPDLLMDPVTPHLPETPGVPRPRTRGARRRVQPADAFPLLFSSHRPPIATSTTTTVHRSRHLDDSRDEDDGRLRADALRSRLQATGVKRSLVQAQLFPEPSNQRDASHCRVDTPLSTLHTRASGADGHVLFGYDASSVDNTPLAPSRARVAGGALIPSRPTTSSSLVSGSRRQRAPHSARDVSLATDAQPLKVPMTARDRYYVEKRATTAPAPSALQGTKRRPLIPSSQSSGSDQRPPTQSHASKSTLQTHATQPLSASKGDAAELPRRHELLSQARGFQTLTESIADQMKASTNTQRGVVDKSPHCAVAHQAALVGGAAVPRDSFLYLRRVDSNPYSLSLTTHAHIDPDDYYTVSRLGVTHFAYQSSEFVTMEAFEREKYLYSLIVKVRS